MEDYINESAETQEVAEPEEYVGDSEETQEAAEPEQAEESTEEQDEPSFGRTEQDAAFAEMRRQNKQLEREKKQMMEALSRYFDGETPEDLSINAIAYADQRDPEDYRQEWEQTREFEELKATNESLEDELYSLKAEKLMRDDLAKIQSLDPNVKSLDELGGSFLRMRLDGGLSATEAYWACKAQTMREKVLAPEAIGRISEAKTERDYFTSEELDALTDEELNDEKIWAKAMRSLERL